ncbi:MAG: AMP-binding protein, partial [Lentisphaeraceae bacterium]|nr:AMP-binding protein [Lentisphaeraceae bacterium]
MSYFFQSLESFSERTAIILKDRGRISYRELASKADDFLTQLPKEPVLIFIEMANELEAIVAYLGALRGNHPAILACPQRAELTEQIKSIYQPDAIYEKIEGKWKLTVNTLKGDLHSDLGILLSTSGSTGSPKCIKLSQKNLNSNAKSIVEYLHIDDKQRAIANLPLYYSYGLSVLNSHLEAGASLVLTDESVADDSFWDLFKKEEVTSLAGVPYVYEMLDRRGFYDMHLPSLQYLTQAGGRLAPELARKFALDSLDKKRLFYVMYGQTEATARIAYMPPCKLIENTKCMGVPIPGGQIKLYDGQREITETDTAGELVYSGPNVMMGYAESRSDLIKPAEVKELRTGDIACKNNEGLYYIVGRQSRFLKLFGLRINLDEVETFLRRQGYEAICGGTDQQLVVLSTNIGQAAKIKEMIISQYKLSPTVVTAIEEDKIPLLPSGKINYKKLIDFAKNPNKINENFEKLGFLKKIRNFIINTEEKAEKCIAESFKDILGLNHIPQEENFKSLSGDSLSYVNLSIELEEKLGYLPDNWEDKSIAELKELSLQKRTINKTDNHWKS